MDEPGAHELTELLLAWGNGDDEALARIAPLVHAELYRLAKRYMSKERPDHLLQTSTLINEAYVRLIDWKAVRWQNGAHFFGVAAQMMRRILVDFARKRPKLDKDVEALNISLDEAMAVTTDKDVDLLALDEALKSLAVIDERRSQTNQAGTEFFPTLAPMVRILFLRATRKGISTCFYSGLGGRMQDR
jgi:RNA polymerase sigma factor (TIGR02999 family)